MKVNLKIILPILIAVVLLISLFLFQNKESISNSENQQTSLNVMLKEIYAKLLEWTGDYQIRSCETRDYNGIGFNSLSCLAVSASKKQILTALWNENLVKLSQPTTVNEVYLELAKSEFSFNNIPVDKLNVLENALSLFLQSNSEYKDKDLKAYIGEDLLTRFENQYVWSVSFYEQKETDKPYEVLTKIYINATTGDIVE